MDSYIYFEDNTQKLNLAELKFVRPWILLAANLEGYQVGELGFIFCDDQFLNSINVEFLEHDTYTDIITFDYSSKTTISGEIYISMDRVLENSKLFQSGIQQEIHRIIIHGVLHLLGYKDKSPEDKAQMNSKEDYYLSLRHDLG